MRSPMVPLARGMIKSDLSLGESSFTLLLFYSHRPSSISDRAPDAILAGVCCEPDRRSLSGRELSLLDDNVWANGWAVSALGLQVPSCSPGHSHAQQSHVLVTRGCHHPQKNSLKSGICSAWIAARSLLADQRASVAMCI